MQKIRNAAGRCTQWIMTAWHTFLEHSKTSSLWDTVVGRRRQRFAVCMVVVRISSEKNINLWANPTSEDDGVFPTAGTFACMTPPEVTPLAPLQAGRRMPCPYHTHVSFPPFCPSPPVCTVTPLPPAAIPSPVRVPPTPVVVSYPRLTLSRPSLAVHPSL